MTDTQFIARLNAVAAESGLDMASGRRSESASGAGAANLAAFLETCVRRGIELSDPRWRRLTLRREGASSSFHLTADTSGEPDTEFRVGLQMLMGILGEADETDIP